VGAFHLQTFNYTMVRSGLGCAVLAESIRGIPNHPSGAEIPLAEADTGKA
jgi:hypothetical protein